MSPAHILRYARRHAALSQRELAQRTGIAQPTIARIEKGLVSPRVATLVRLLEACKFRLGLSRLEEETVDRSTIRQLLALTPAERLRIAAEEAENMAELLSTTQ